MVDRKSTIPEQRGRRSLDRSKVGIAEMNFWTKQALAAAFVMPMLAVATPADAGVGDLLVAPTRLVLDGRKGAEIILNNLSLIHI